MPPNYSSLAKIVASRRGIARNDMKPRKIQLLREGSAVAVQLGAICRKRRNPDEQHPKELETCLSAGSSATGASCFEPDAVTSKGFQA